MLNPTPREKLLDSQGRPYFLWDCDMTADEFQRGLGNPDPNVRAYLVAKLMRQRSLTTFSASSPPKKLLSSGKDSSGTWDDRARFGPGSSRDGMPRDEASDRLSSLQWRILRVLSKLRPAWTLSGGGALVGFYLKHRETKDLGLFWHCKKGARGAATRSARFASGRRARSFRHSNFIELPSISGLPGF